MSLSEAASEYISVYCKELPPLLTRLAAVQELKRLDGISMHCGCDYAGFPVYKKIRGPYSRYVHSLAVAGIIWKFTKDIKQTVAGLMHDIATPVFAHTVDFMNRDYLVQESTEEKTEMFIKESKEIMRLLTEAGIKAEEVSDYHRYPVADNATPMLSADRLEYTLGNSFFVYRWEIDKIKEIYNKILLGTNEKQIEELCFGAIGEAETFTRVSLQNCRLFISPENRYAMQYLADLLRNAMEKQILSEADLFSTEPEVIRKLKSNKDTAKLWEIYQSISQVTEAAEKEEGKICVKVPAKKRYINPLVKTEAGFFRITDLKEEVKDEMQAVLEKNLDLWLCPV